MSHQEHVSDADAGFVLENLEPDQLALAKKVPVPRRKLKGFPLVLAWALRLYLVFMLLVVCWQAWNAIR